MDEITREIRQNSNNRMLTSKIQSTLSHDDDRDMNDGYMNIEKQKHRLNPLRSGF